LRRLPFVALLATVLLAGITSNAGGSTIRVEPGGETRWSARGFTYEALLGMIRVRCNLVLEGNFERTTRGTLGLGGNNAGSVRRYAVSECVGGTMRFLGTEARMAFESIEARSATQNYLPINFLIESEGFRCLYEMLWRFRGPEPGELELVAIRILRIITLTGSPECEGESTIRMNGRFRVSPPQRITLTEP